MTGRSSARALTISPDIPEKRRQLGLPMRDPLSMPVALDLPGPRRRIRVEPVRTPEPEPIPERQPAPREPSEPVPAEPQRRESEPEPLRR